MFFKSAIVNNFFSKENKSVLNSFVSLGFIQLTNMVLPLLTIPYLVKTVGTEKYGVIAVAQSFSNYLAIISEYGFNLSATREIAINRHNKEKVSQVLSSVLATKGLLCLLAFVILLAILNFVPQFNREKQIYFFVFGSVIGQSLMPIWFFQGMEKMKYLTYLNFFSKLLFTLLIFVAITSPGDYIYVTLFQSFGNILAGGIALLVVIKHFNVKFTFPKPHEIIYQIKNGWYIFVSNFSIISYNNSNLFILGLFADPVTVGYYSIPEKISFAVRQLNGAFASATYPHVCMLATKSHKEIKVFYKSIFLPFALFMFLLCACIFVFSGEIIYFVSGNHISEAAFFLKLLSFVPFIVLLGNAPYQVLLAYDIKAGYMKILMLTAVVNLALNFILVNVFSAVGTSVALISTELFVAVGFFVVLERRYRKYSLLR